MTNASGLVTEYAYDLMDRVTNIVYRTSGGTEIARFGYARDTIGRIASRTVAVGGAASGRAYAYDALDRLASETLSGDAGGPSTTSYTYDLAGNRSIPPPPRSSAKPPKPSRTASPPPRHLPLNRLQCPANERS